MNRPGCLWHGQRPGLLVTIREPLAIKGEAFLNIAALYGDFATLYLPLFPVWIEIRA